MANPAAVAIAQSLGVSKIDATRSPQHAALAQAEAETHAAIVEGVLRIVGLTPDVVQAALAHRAALVEA